MSKCDLALRLDHADARYRGGEVLRGTVVVTAHQEVKANAVTVEHSWKTHGRGNTARSVVSRLSLFEGTLPAGVAQEFPFELNIPPLPVSYHGHYLNVDHYLDVRVDIPWAIDVKMRQEVLVEPGKPVAAPTVDPQKSANTAAQVVVIVVVASLFVFVLGPLLFSGHWIGIAAGIGGLTVLGLLAFRRSLARRRLGDVQVQFETYTPVPGARVPVRVYVKPPRAVELNAVHAHLKGVERVVSGSGTNRHTYTHAVHDSTVQLSGPQRVEAGAPTRIEGEVRIPLGAPFSFDANDNDLEWTVKIDVDIARWPDWSEQKKLFVGPWRSAGAPQDDRDRSVPPRLEAFEEAPPLFREPGRIEPPPMLSDDSLRSEPEVAPSLPAAVPSPEPVSVPADGPLDAAGLAALAASLKAAGANRGSLVEEVTGREVQVEVAVERIDWTFGTDVQPPFKDGRTLVGRVPGTETEIGVRFAREHTDAVDALKRGATLAVHARLVGWNDLYGRPTLEADGL